MESEWGRRLSKVYTSPKSTDYSRSSSLARYALALHYRPPGGPSLRVLDLGCGAAGLLNFAQTNSIRIDGYVGVESRKTVVPPEIPNGANYVYFSESLADVEGTFDLIVALGLVSYQLSDNPKNDVAAYSKIIRDAMTMLTPFGRIVLTLRKPNLTRANKPLFITPKIDQFAAEASIEIIHYFLAFPDEYFLVGRLMTDKHR